MRNHKQRGQGIIEVTVAALVIIPLVLFLFDVMVVIETNLMNDKLAKSAARAAANQGDENLAHQAAEDSLSSFQLSPYVTDIQITQFQYSAQGNVVLQLQMEVKLPVPLPGYTTVNFTAQDVEPVVGYQNAS